MRNNTIEYGAKILLLLLLLLLLVLLVPVLLLLPLWLLWLRYRPSCSCSGKRIQKRWGSAVVYFPVGKTRVYDVHSSHNDQAAGTELYVSVGMYIVQWSSCLS